MSKKRICFDMDEKCNVKNIKYLKNDEGNDIDFDLNCDDYGCTMDE
jgi:hypothetical protein